MCDCVVYDLRVFVFVKKRHIRSPPKLNFMLCPEQLRAARFIELLDDHDFLVEDVSTPLLSPRTTWNVNLPSVFEPCH